MRPFRAPCREGDSCLKTHVQLASDSNCATPAVRRKLFSVTRFVCLAGLIVFASLLCNADNFKKKSQRASAAPPAPVTHPAVAKITDSRLAPLPASDKVVAYHAPYDAGDCSICHKSNDAQNPGPLTAKVNDLCLGCHDNFKENLSRKYPHPAAVDSCVNCHNPHNSTQPHLLLEDTGALCTSCHTEIKKLSEESNVKHGALYTGGKCVNCHNPHGSNVEHLLVTLPMQLCLQCHGKDDVADPNGKKLTNMVSLLNNNSHQHAPVASQDCSACHMPHGSSNFRLLTNAYPPQFYSGYDEKNYALCFGCHEQKAFTTPQTSELTQFRNGTKNLHYVHVNKDIMGRTCRACHEVHASPQEHQIRDAVPYGPKGWMLKLNYTKTETGGSCARTCHSTRSYNYTLKAADAAPAPAAATATPAAAPAAAAAPSTASAKP
jgi:predicted CXXCH cytochrome family protein